MWKTLGISPTTDIKAIKSAYAKLAKQYNPEEYPEEFQKIFDAYKSACAYAKRYKSSGTALSAPPKTEYTEQTDNKHDFSGIDLSRKQISANNTSDEDDLDFSGIDTSRKHPVAEEISDEGELDFSGVDTSRKHPVTEEISDEDELDFSGVDTSRKHPVTEEISDEGELDFSEIDISYHPPGVDTPEKKEEAPVFDFSRVNDKYDESDEKKRIISLRIRLTERLRKLSINGTFSQWTEFFEKTHFDELTNEYVFRTNAAKLLNGRAFSKDVAQLIAEKFGNGTMFNRLSFFSKLYQIFIPIGNQHIPQKPAKRKISLIHVIAVIAVIVFLIPSIMIIFGVDQNDYAQDTSNSNIVTLRPYNEGEPAEEYLIDSLFEITKNTSFSADDLYIMCIGKWEFSFGYIIFFEDNLFEMNYRDEVFNGEISYTAAEKDALLYLTLNAPETEINGFTGSAKLFHHNGKAMVIKNNDGNIFMGKYIYDEDDSTE